MSAIEIIKRRLKEERIPEVPWPDEISEKKKRPREVAFMDVNLCFPCGKVPYMGSGEERGGPDESAPAR